MMKFVVTSLFILAMAVPSAAFQPLATGRSSTCKLEATRQEFLQTIAGSVVATTFLNPQLVRADDETTTTEEEDKRGVSNILNSSSLRNLKRSQKQFSRMEFYAADNDYQGLKGAIREAPFSDIRKTASSISKELEPTKQEEFMTSYKKFIATLEKLDSNASLGMRGRKLDDGVFLKSYDDCVKALSEMIDLAVSFNEA